MWARVCIQPSSHQAVNAKPSGNPDQVHPRVLAGQEAVQPALLVPVGVQGAAFEQCTAELECAEQRWRETHIAGMRNEVLHGTALKTSSDMAGRRQASAPTCMLHKSLLPCAVEDGVLCRQLLQGPAPELESICDVSHPSLHMQLCICTSSQEGLLHGRPQRIRRAKDLADAALNSWQAQL